MTFVACAMPLLLPIALVLSIVAIVRIQSNGGTLCGKGYATLALIISLLGMLCWGVVISRRALWSMANTILCGHNAAEIGKQMLIYSNDYEDALPAAGNSETKWTAKLPDWKASGKADAFQSTDPFNEGQASISASLFLLVKYAEAIPASFSCRWDISATNFRLAIYQASLPEETELGDV